MSLFKTIRVAILLVILVVVAGNHWLGQSRLTGWDRSLWVTFYPLVIDGAPDTIEYARQVNAGTFQEINDFLEREARRYGLRINTPVRINVMPLSANLPPPVPRTNNPLVVAWWSLKMRYWAWRQMRGVPGLEPDIQVFVQYREASSQPLLDRSVGMQKGRYALVQAYADEASTARNNFVIAHELLHVLGATDKYDPLTGQALKPEGLAEPDRQPLFPQQHAEVMAGVVALTPSRGRMPTSLNECVIGAETAQEIGW